MEEYDQWLGTNQYRYSITPTAVYRSDTKICSDLRITKKVKDSGYDGYWLVHVVWHDPDGKLHERAFRRSMLYGRSTRVVEILADGGLNVADSKAVMEYLRQCDYRLGTSDGT